MKYRTVYGLKFYGHVFDIDTRQHFRVTNGRWFGRCGYFLLKQADNDEWTILKQVVSKEYGREEQLNTLPLFARLSLYTFLRDNLYKYKEVQRIVNNMIL